MDERVTGLERQRTQARYGIHAGRRRLQLLFQPLSIYVLKTPRLLLDT